MKNRLESIVIVKNNNGCVATIHYSNKFKSRSISAPNKQLIYAAIEKYVGKVSNG